MIHRRFQTRTRPVWARIILPLLLASLFLGMISGWFSLVAWASGLEISKTAPASVRAGDVFTYTLTITNTTGGENIVVIEDHLPLGTAVVNRGGGLLSGGKLQWAKTITSIPITLQFSVVATQTGGVSNNNYSASSGLLSGIGDPVNTTITPDDPASIQIAANPNPVTVAQTTTVTLSVFDQYGNLVADGTPLSLVSDVGTLAGQPAGTPANDTTTSGQVMMPLVGDTVATTAHLTATVNTIQQTASVIFNPGPPHTLNTLVSPGSVPANGSATATVMATITDQYNNLVNQTPVTFTTNLGSLAGNGSTTVANTSAGVAAVSLAGTTAGTATITITVANLTPEIETVYLAPGPPSRLTLQANPATIQANGVSSSTLTLQIFDGNDNLVDTATPITMTTTLGTLPGGGTTFTATPTNGTLPVALTAGTETGVANVAVIAAGLTTDVDVTFGSGSPTQVALAIQRTAIAANGVSTSLITATVRDGFNNVVDTPVAVTFAAELGTIEPNNSGLTTNGILVRTLRSSTTLGTSAITATAAGIGTPATGSIDFIIGPPKNANITLNPTSPITVGVPVTMTLTIYDVAGHLVPNATITVTSFLGTIGPSPTATTDGAGQLQRTLVSTRSGSDLLGVFGSNGALTVNGGSATFAPDIPALANISASPTELIANGSTTANITAVIKDQYGNLISGYVPDFTTTLGTLSGSSPTNLVGVVERTLQSSTQLGTATISMNGVATVNQATVDFVTGPPAAGALLATPKTALVGQNVTLVMTVTDSIGHPISGETPYVSSSFGTISNCSVTNAQGVMTCTLFSTQNGQPIIAVNGFPTSGDTVTYLPDSLDKIVVTPAGTFASPISQGSGIPIDFNATGYDQYNNLLTGLSFSWTKASFGGDGLIDADGLFSGTRSGLVAVSAHSSGLSGVSFVNVASGPPAQAAITADRTSVPADGVETASLSIQIQDAYGNPIGFGIPVTATASLGLVEGSTPTDATGTVYRTIRSTTAGFAQISLTDIFTLTGDTTIEFRPGSPAKAIVTATPNQLPPNGAAQSTIRVVLKDSLNNPVGAGYNPVVQASAGALSGSGLTDSAGAVTRTLTAPTSDGVANFTVKYQGVPLPLSGDSVTFVAGPIHHVDVTPASPVSAKAGQPIVFTAQAYDVDNALLPANRVGYSWPFLTFTGTGSGIRAPQLGQQTVFTGTVAGTGVKLTAWAVEDGTLKSKQIDITVSPGASVVGTMTASSSSVTADGSSPITLTLTNLIDGYGNDSANGEIITVTVYSQPTPQTVQTVISGGEAIATIAATTQAGTYDVFAYSENGQLSLSGDTELTFTAGPPAQAEVISANPATLVANGVSTSTVTIEVQDIFGNAVASGQPLVITATLGTVLPSGSGTDENGVVTRTLQSSLDLGQAILNVENFPTSGLRIPFVPGPPAVATITLITPTLAVGANSIPISFTVQDAWGHAVADGAVITPTVTPAYGLFSGSNQISGGTLNMALVSNTSVGTATITVPGVTLSGDKVVTFVPGPAGLAHIAATPQTRIVGGSVMLDITVTDIYSNIVPPTSITITAPNDTLDSAGSTVTKTTANNTGRVSLNLYSTIAGTKTIGLSGPNGSITVRPESDAILFLPGDPAYVNIDDYSVLTATATIPVTVQISSRDVYGNAIDPWYTVNYTWWQQSLPGNPGYGTITPQSAPARTITFLPMYVGTNKLWTTGGVQQSNKLDVTVLPGPPGVATASVSPPNRVANGQDLYTIDLTHITDRFGNLVVDGAPLTITVQSSPSVVGFTTTSNQAASVVLTATTLAGQHPILVEGSHGSVVLSGTTHARLLPGLPARANISPVKTTLPGDGSSTTKLNLTIYDENFNLVANGTPITVTSSLGTVTGNSTTNNGAVVRTLHAPVALGTATFIVEGPHGPLFVTGDTVTFVADVPASVHVDANPAQVLADGDSSSLLTLTLQDANGFDVDASGTAQLSVERGSLSIETATLVSGVFTTTFYSDTSLGSAGLAITYEGEPMTITGDNLELVAGPPVSATVSANPTTLKVGTDEQSILTITLFDAWGHPVADGTDVTLLAPVGQFFPDDSTTVNGVVTRILTAGIVTGIFHVVIESSAVGDTIPAVGDSVTIIPDVLDHIDILPAGPVEVVSGQPLAFTAIGRDKFDNETGTGQFVWRRVLGTGGGLLDANGILTGTIIGEIGVQASQGTVFSPIKSVTIVPGEPVTAVVRADPPAISVGGEKTILTITVRDRYGNLVADDTPLTISTNLGTLEGTSTVKSGVLTRALISDRFFGIADIFVNGWEAAGDKPAITPVAQVIATPNTLLADGQSQTELNIRIIDPSGQPVPDGTQVKVTTTLGSLTESINTTPSGTSLFGGTVNGQLFMQLQAPLTPGIAQFYVNDTLASGVVTFTVGPPAVADIRANSALLIADGKDATRLTITVKDAYDHVLVDAEPIVVSTSLGTLGPERPMVNGVTTRMLTTGLTSGIATLSVEGLTTTGDRQIAFVGALSGGNFEDDAMTGWVIGNVVTSTGYPFVYTTMRLQNDQVGEIAITPIDGEWMMRLGATTPDNTDHGISEAWLNQSVYVETGGITQLHFHYRILSYDVSVGSELLGYQEWDPFEVYINGTELLQDGFPWTPEWQSWYGPPLPPSPQDTDWKLGVLDLTAYAGDIVTVEFRMSNRQAALDNSWVYVDAVQMKYLPVNKVFLPLVLRSAVATARQNEGQPEPQVEPLPNPYRLFLPLISQAQNRAGGSNNKPAQQICAELDIRAICQNEKTQPIATSVEPLK